MRALAAKRASWQGSAPLDAKFGRANQEVEPSGHFRSGHMEPGGSPWRRRLRGIFGLDLRSLALFRIGLGIILLFDIIIRYEDVHAFYTDEGVLPRAGVLVFNQGMSVHMLGGSLTYEVALFYLH